MKSSKTVSRQRKDEVAQFSFSLLIQAAIVIVTIAVVVVVGIDLVNDTGKDICDDKGGVFEDNRCWNESTTIDGHRSLVSDQNATYDSITGLGNITSKLGTLVTAIVGIVIIGIIIRLLGGLGGTGDMGGIKLR